MSGGLSTTLVGQGCAKPETERSHVSCNLLLDGVRVIPLDHTDSWDRTVVM